MDGEPEWLVKASGAVLQVVQSKWRSAVSGAVVQVVQCCVLPPLVIPVETSRVTLGSNNCSTVTTNTVSDTQVLTNRLTHCLDYCIDTA